MRLKRIIAYALFCILLLQLIMPCGTVFATTELIDNSKDIQTEPTVIEEVTGLRETNSETYLLSDGTYDCVVYSEDKYYRNESNELIQIDNSIISTDYKGYSYKNASNSIEYYFGDSASVLLKKQSGSVAFAPYGSNSNKAVIGSVKYSDVFEELILTGSNSISYRNVFKNVDIIYNSNTNSLKEFIVIKNFSAPNEYFFDYSFNGYYPELTKDNRIMLYNAGTKVAEYELGKLFAVDAAGVYTTDLEYTLEKTGENQYKIGVMLSSDYFQSPERVFPIVIDPSHEVTGANKTYDSFVSSVNSNNNYVNYYYLRTGYESSLGIRRTFIRFVIPDILNNKTVTSAYINIRKCAEQAPTAKAYKVTSSWSSSTVTWNNMPSWTTTNCSNTPTAGSNGWYKFYITSIVQSWLNQSSTNFGVMLKEPSETLGQSTVYYSSDAASPNKPELHIVYNFYYGSRGYQQTLNSSESNCMGYALEYKLKIDWINMGIGPSAIDGTNVDELLQVVRNGANTWMNNHMGQSNYRIINYYNSDIYVDSFRVVLRVGFYDLDGDGYCNVDLEEHDFHWMYQTNENSGQWANKHGNADSNRIGSSGGADPTQYTSEWIASPNEYISYPYTSNPVYYEIKDLRTITW